MIGILGESFLGYSRWRLGTQRHVRAHLDEKIGGDDHESRTVSIYIVATSRGKKGNKKTAERRGYIG